ncbi:MAG: hypothetical protein Q7S51_12290 [Gallionellaceae bacterium]|nr:hypothetical protein [Gallionellaceae bacterium]
MLRNLRNICLGIALSLLANFNLAHAVPLGAVMTDFGNYDLATATAIQADGKIVVAGESGGSSGYNAALARYLPDGRLDTSFGTAGKTTLDLAGCPCNEEIHAVVIQADGKIVIAGSAVPGSTGTGTHFVIARFNANGTVDTGFGTGGKVFIELGGYYEYVYALVIQSDGKIVAAGDSDGDFALARVTKSGRMDNAFGSGGKVRTDFDGYTDEARGVVVQSSGKIVAGGFAETATGWDFALVRYTSEGILDSTFGTGGKVTTDMGGSYERAFDLIQQADGKLVLAGFYYDEPTYTSQWALARYNGDGQLDNGFGVSGISRPLTGTASALAQQSDGKLIAGGQTTVPGFSVARLLADGSLDTSYGTNGVASTDFIPDNYSSSLYNLALQGDNKAIAVGMVRHNSGYDADFGVVRYDTEGVLDSAFGPRTDLAVTIADSPDPVQAGGDLTYTTVVSNSGTEAAQKVEIGGIPGNTTLVSATSTLGTCTGATCQIGTLSAGASATVTVMVKPYLNGTLSHSVTVSSITADANSANDSATTSTVINGNADLALSMSDSPDPVKAGQNVTYVVTVRNTGAGIANDVVLSDHLPNAYYATYVSHTASQGSCTLLSDTPYYGEKSLRCSLGQLNGGASATVSIMVTPAIASTTLQNSAEVQALGDSNLANNTASEQTLVGNYADIGVTLSGNLSSATTGQQVTYTMQVSNAGPDATGARASLNFPYYTRVISVNSAQATCTTDLWTVACTTNTLAVGANASVTMVVEFSMTGSLVVSASAGPDTSDVRDLDYNNNTTNTFVTVSGEADLAVTVTSSAAEVSIGAPITYTVTVTNHGPDGSGPVRAMMTFPGIAITSGFYGSSTGCDGYYNSYEANFCGGLKHGSVWTITYTGNYSGTGSGQLQAALQQYYVTDPNSSNDSAQVTTTVTGSADLTVSMSGPATATVNGTATYTVVVNNQGPDTASQVVLSGFVPQDYSVVSATSSQGNCYYPPYNYQFGCDLYTMPGGGSVTVSVVVQPLKRRVTITPSVTATSQVADPNTANNTASSSTYIK